MSLLIFECSTNEQKQFLRIVIFCFNEEGEEKKFAIDYTM